MRLVSAEQCQRQGGIRWCKQHSQHQVEVVFQPGTETFLFVLWIKNWEGRNSLGNIDVKLPRIYNMNFSAPEPCVLWLLRWCLQPVLYKYKKDYLFIFLGLGVSSTWCLFTMLIYFYIFLFWLEKQVNAIFLYFLFFLSINIASHSFTFLYLISLPARLSLKAEVLLNA